jgi:hypothetical protein
MVVLPGHDMDPKVARDVTYVLERPTSRAFKTAYGSQWLFMHKAFDFVLYLDDDSVVSVPRLMEALAGKGPRMAMGYLMNTPLDWSALDMGVCDVCQPCEHCMNNPELDAFCSQFDQGMTKVACYAAIKNCQVMPPIDETTGEAVGLDVCVKKVYWENVKIAQYFGSKWAPTWMLGMGWVFGREIVEYIATNIKFLKMRGAADVILGFWLAGVEDVQWVDMAGGAFHDYPARGSTFSSGCTGKSTLVHRMKLKYFADMDNATCTLVCPETADENSEFPD